MPTTRPHTRADGLRDRLLAIYLNDHLAGAAGGVTHIRRMTRAYASTPLAPRLRELAEEIAEERAVLRGVMERLGIPVRRYKLLAGWLAEAGSRFKPNGLLTRRSPLTALLDLELMRSAVMGKRGTWQTLRVLPLDTGLGPREIEELLARTSRQLEVLDELSEQVRARVFGAVHRGLRGSANPEFRSAEAPDREEAPDRKEAPDRTEQGTEPGNE